MRGSPRAFLNLFIGFTEFMKHIYAQNHTLMRVLDKEETSHEVCNTSVSQSLLSYTCCRLLLWSSRLTKT